MPASAAPGMYIDGLNIMSLIKETGLGLAAILLVTIFHGFFSKHILLQGERSIHGHASSRKINVIAIKFYLSILALVLVHVGEILLWAFSLELFDLTDNLLNALLVAGSTYTTVGFEADSLKPGWKFYPVFIAVSGLFNFAWSTSTMMTLLTQAREALKAKAKA